MIDNCENTIILIGHVGTKPQKIHENPSGVRFRLATNETFFSRRKNDYVKQTEWHSIKAWKQDAEYSLENIDKGDYVYILGKMHYHEVTGDNDRRIRNPEIIANKVIKLNRIPKNNENESNKDKIEEEIKNEETCDSV